ncbi:hypothetical protein AAEO57_00175 [Flavobacterium sp. DGU38]|uniref:AAA family ATPase n=1 Tax=Flavobacterium calami TaxID=3139144 RepID=A0ABU9IIE4_9FLAO
MKDKILNLVYNFFIKSSDFNGIPLRSISKEMEIEYEKSINIIKELVNEGSITIQSSTNPHIIGFGIFPIEKQIQILEQAKDTKVKIQKIGEVEIRFERTKFPICLYPSSDYLKINRDVAGFNNAFYIQQLALGEPQLKPVFFEIEVLDRYFNDPRFDFNFKDYSGRISCRYDENGKAILRDEDNVFLKSFGLGVDENNNRLAVVYLRYLKDLTAEHQMYWKGKEKSGKCTMLEEYRQNTIEGNWSSSHSIFSAFLAEQKAINELTQLIFSKTIFRKTFESEERPKEFTFFFVPTLKNYNDFILLLDKMISENIDKDFFEGKIALFEYKEVEEGIVEKQWKGTLQLFEEWLRGEYEFKDQETAAKLFKPLKKIRRERQTPAHRINENEYDSKYIERQKEVMKEAYSVFRNLRFVFQQHPSALDYGIPKWLEKGQIKVF